MRRPTSSPGEPPAPLAPKVKKKAHSKRPSPPMVIGREEMNMITGTITSSVRAGRATPKARDET